MDVFVQLEVNVGNQDQVELGMPWDDQKCLVVESKLTQWQIVVGASQS